MASVVVDTNVALAANGDAKQANPECVLRCVQELIETRNSRLLLLDEAGLILQEYLKQKPHGFPQGPGDAFLVWAHDNQANPACIRTVPITPLDGNARAFAEFPDDPELSAFDHNDRKFVAVALASGLAPSILNATDSDWWHHRTALTRNGVHVEFLCPRLMTEQD
ncbi:MAG: hypothetical protein HY423_16670 [Candidatus Lambdaproteobacteria bacterium]|nr:hypothetical protein [Candidatus Lambdaproteobacteria bacterium]